MSVSAGESWTLTSMNPAIKRRVERVAAEVFDVSRFISTAVPGRLSAANWHSASSSIRVKIAMVRSQIGSGAWSVAVRVVDLGVFENKSYLDEVFKLC